MNQFSRAVDAAGYFFSPSEIRWLNERFQASNSNGIAYMDFIYWSTPEAVQLDVVIQHIRSDVTRAEQYGKYFKAKESDASRIWKSTVD